MIDKDVSGVSVQQHLPRPSLSRSFGRVGASAGLLATARLLGTPLLRPALDLCVGLSG